MYFGWGVCINNMHTWSGEIHVIWKLQACIFIPSAHPATDTTLQQNAHIVILVNKHKF